MPRLTRSTERSGDRKNAEINFRGNRSKARSDRVDGKIGSRLRGGLANVLPPFYQDRRGGSTFARPGAARRASSHSSRVRRRNARVAHARPVAHSSRRDQGGRGGRAAASTVVVRPTTAVAVGSQLRPKIGSPRFSGRDHPPWAATVMCPKATPTGRGTHFRGHDGPPSPHAPRPPARPPAPPAASAPLPRTPTLAVGSGRDPSAGGGVEARMSGDT